MVYTIHQTNTAGDTNFTLDGGGTQTYSRTDTVNANTGDRSSTETGSDAYSLTDIGTDSAGSYTQSLSGIDPYTTIVTSNDLNGGYTRTTSGSGDYSLTESDGGGDPVTTGGSHQFSTTSSGNYIDGQVSLNATGVDHYHLLRGFNDTSNGGTCTAGTVDYSPVGAAFFLGTGVMGPTGGAARAAATDAVFGDPGSLPYQHCFVAGTPVLTGGGKTRPIDQIQPGEAVLAVSDSDPQAKPQPRRVERVFANGPQPIFAVVVEGQSIFATAGHPFHVLGKGWTPVKDLKCGDVLLGHDGRGHSVEKVIDTGRVEPVYNIQVAEDHTYFVGSPDGRFGVLVHNVSPNNGDGFRAAPPRSMLGKITDWASDLFSHDETETDSRGLQVTNYDDPTTASFRHLIGLYNSVAKGVNEFPEQALKGTVHALDYAGAAVKGAVDENFGDLTQLYQNDQESYTAYNQWYKSLPELRQEQENLRQVGQIAPAVALPLILRGSAAGTTVPEAGASENAATGAVRVLDAPGEMQAATTVGDLRTAGLRDAHHVIQDAAVRDLPGYDTNLAPGRQLAGPSTAPGTPHYEATQVQRLPGGGTYGAERQIGLDALRAAGYSEEEALRAIQEADNYFGSIGVGPSTPTRIPGNR